MYCSGGRVGTIDGPVEQDLTHVAINLDEQTAVLVGDVGELATWVARDGTIDMNHDEIRNVMVKLAARVHHLRRHGAEVAAIRGKASDNVEG